MRRLIPLTVLLASVGAASAQPPAPKGDDRPRPTIPNNGSEVFRYLLHQRGVKPVTQAEANRMAAGGRFAGLIVVVLGTDTRGQPVGGLPPLQWAASATQQGGAALVATDSYADFGVYFPPVRGFDRPGGSVVGHQVHNTDPGVVYAGTKNCPFAVPYDPPPGARRPGPEWDLFRGLNRVATNRPSALYLPRPRAEFGSVLAGFPDNTQFGDGNQPQELNLVPADYHLAAGGSGSRPDALENYRFLAVADSSVFINEMMVQLNPQVPPPDNLEFADRVTKYLVEEDGRPVRTRCLFLVNGQVVERLDVLRDLLRPERPPLPMPNIDALRDKIIDMGNTALDKAQTTDLMHRTVVGGNDETQTTRVRTLLLVLAWPAAVFAILFLLRKVWGVRQPGDVPPAQPGGLPVPAGGRKPDGLFARRQKELLRRNDLSEPVRAAVRELFRSAGVPHDAGPRLPAVRVSDAVRRPGTLREALADLWAIGFGPPAPVSARRWATLEPLFVRARQAYADGKWAFVDYSEV